MGARCHEGVRPASAWGHDTKVGRVQAPPSKGRTVDYAERMGHRASTATVRLAVGREETEGACASEKREWAVLSLARGGRGVTIDETCLETNAGYSRRKFVAVATVPLGKGRGEP